MPRYTVELTIDTDVDEFTLIDALSKALGFVEQDNVISGFTIQKVVENG